METKQSIEVNEASLANRFYWVLIRTTAILALTKYAGLGIAILLLFSKSFQVMRDLKAGEVIEITGNLDQKKKMGEVHHQMGIIPREQKRPQSPKLPIF